MQLDLPEDLSSLSDSDLTRIAEEADRVRIEALVALHARGSVASAAHREQRLAAMSPGTRRAAELLMKSAPRRLAFLSMAIATGIMMLGGMGDCARPAAQTIGTTKRVIRDLDEVMKEQREAGASRRPTAVHDEAEEKAWGF